MRTNRRLTLKREAASELTSDDLTAIAGGQALTHTTCGLCLTQVWSYDRCPTTPLNDCLSRLLVGEDTATCK